MAARHVRPALARLLPALSVGFAILALALVLDIGIWGWSRFKADFWPLDSSRIGPNLLASLAITVAVLAHNEYRTVRRDEAHHLTMRQMMQDVLDEALHPAEQAEEHIAEAMEGNDGTAA